jgi:sRNA-binding regulator protein Hfq
MTNEKEGNVSSIDDKRTLQLNEQQHQRRKSQKPAVGHEIALASMKKNSRPVDIIMMDGGDFIGVEIMGFDPYTVTVRENGEPNTIFKHAVRNFRAHVVKE